MGKRLGTFEIDLRYNPSTGYLFRKTPTGWRRCGVDRGDGYMRFEFNRKKLYVHRVIWFLHYGRWPVGEIDHINGNPRDNRIENLRDCSHAENLRNSAPSGERKYKGAFLVKRLGRWKACIHYEGKNYHLGYFASLERAALAYDAKAIELYGAFARLNFPERKTA